MIARMGLQALKGANLPDFMNRIVEEVHRTLGTEFCKVLEVQPEGQSLLLRAGIGWREGLVGATPSPPPVRTPKRDPRRSHPFP